MFTQLNPPIPLETPKGVGMAIGVIDYGPDYDLLWVVLDDATGECWTYNNAKVRGVKNITMGRRTTIPPSSLGGRLAVADGLPFDGLKNGIGHKH